MYVPQPPWKILSLEIDLISQNTMATIVFPKLKIISGLKIFQETGPLGPKLPYL